MAALDTYRAISPDRSDPTQCAEQTGGGHPGAGAYRYCDLVISMRMFVDGWAQGRLPSYSLDLTKDVASATQWPYDRCIRAMRNTTTPLPYCRVEATTQHSELEAAGGASLLQLPKLGSSRSLAV